MVDTIREWRPHPRQEEMLRWKGIRELLFGGARGGGKTEAGIVWVSKPAIHRISPRFRGLVLRENAVDLSDWCDRAVELLGSTGAKLVGSPKQIVWPHGAKLLCGHLKDMRSIRKWLGREFQRILIEEMTQIEAESLYEQLLGSCRSTIKEIEARLLGTTNPGGPGHAWVKRRFVDHPEGTPFRVKNEQGIMSGWRLFIKSLIEDNPTLMLGDPDYLRYLRSLPPDLRAQWLDGSWDLVEGQYYPEFSRARHACRPFEIPPHWRRYRALDWGFFPDPWFCLWFAVDEHGNEVCYREAYGNRMLPKDVAKRILELSEKDGTNFGVTVCGPDAWAEDDGPSSAEKMERAGLTLQKANTDRKNGWMRIHEYLEVNPATGLPWLRFFDTCAEIIRCIPALIHDAKDPMDCAENSQIDHGPDGVRYHLMRRPGRGILSDKIPGWRSLKALRYRKLTQ
jgi:phage terminase large subunit